MKAYELLATPDKWTQGPMARNAAGESVPDLAEDACSWCMFGALVKCYGHSGIAFCEACRRVHEIIGCKIISFNETPGRTHAEVLDVLKRADV